MTFHGCGEPGRGRAGARSRAAATGAGISDHDRAGQGITAQQTISVDQDCQLMRGHARNNNACLRGAAEAIVAPGTPCLSAEAECLLLRCGICPAWLSRPPRAPPGRREAPDSEIRSAGQHPAGWRKAEGRPCPWLGIRLDPHLIPSLLINDHSQGRPCEYSWHMSTPGGFRNGPDRGSYLFSICMAGRRRDRETSTDRHPAGLVSRVDPTPPGRR